MLKHTVGYIAWGMIERIDAILDPRQTEYTWEAFRGINAFR